MNTKSRRGMLVLSSLALAACVDNFEGSKIEIFLRTGVPLPGGTQSVNGRPPSDTHMSIWIMRGGSGMHIADFDLRPAINTSDPCFIEDERSRFPGLHVTKFAAKVRSVAHDPPSEAEAGDIAAADQRVRELSLLEGGLEAMTLHEPGLTEATLDSIRATMPSPDAIDDGSNAARLAACRSAWADHPGWYVGTDKTVAVPIHGTYYGMVQANDPRARIGTPYGGGSIDTPLSFPSFDVFRVSWDFNDPSDPRRNDPSLPPTTNGYDFLLGAPYQRVRGVINADLVNPVNANYTAIISIYTDLNNDDVHF